MGRIVVPVRITNALHPEHAVLCDALVDTGASPMVLPVAWRNRFGTFAKSRVVELESADARTLVGEVCGPVEIQIEGFEPIFNEVVFVDMGDAEGSYVPLVGYIVLEQCRAAVDMVGHRLVPVKALDLRSVNGAERRAATDPSPPPSRHRQPTPGHR